MLGNVQIHDQGERMNQICVLIGMIALVLVGYFCGLREAEIKQKENKAKECIACCVCP